MSLTSGAGSGEVPTVPVGAASKQELQSARLGVRDFMLAALRAELVGPRPGLPAVQSGVGSHAGEEILRPQDSPRLRYGAGILFPQRSALSAQDSVPAAGPDAQGGDEEPPSEAAPRTAGEEDQQDSGAAASVRGPRSEADTEQEVNRANEYLPSAMGLTALVQIPSGGLRVRVRMARYVKNELQDRGWIGKDGEYHPYQAWWRVPIADEVLVPREMLLSPNAHPKEWHLKVGTKDISASIHVFSRPLVSDDSRARAGHDARMVTVTLLNRTEAASSRPKDEECLFQCSFAVDDPGGSGCFLEYPEREEMSNVPDEAALRLLYRNRRIHAVGHGCAPEWRLRGEPSPEWATSTERQTSSENYVPKNSGAAIVWTEVVPAYEERPVVPRELSGLHLSMRILADEESGTPVQLCRQLVAAYRAWIKTEEERIDAGEIPEDMLKTARSNLAQCGRCLERMEDGIMLLETDQRTRRAFALMNRAMLLQQLHYQLASEGRRAWSQKGSQLVLDSPYTPPDYSAAQNAWRPFQLAFILMNMRGLVQPGSPDRVVVDVIWFPTGGGKTEAYLGLTALALFLRRLRNPSNGGTTALMRYTLRLLTAQQYQRAASLICACEKIRREDPHSLGDTRVTIGLWVGGSVTPNKELDAVVELRRLWREGSGNPFVLLSCPWCGAEMGPVKKGGGYETPGYSLLSAPNRVRFICSDQACEFSKNLGLPMLVIDEHIYSEPPSLLLGTVDKFALLPWYPQSASLFGMSPGGQHSPPELIIQDELHLISGPLGSMVGLYETLVDVLCHDRNGIPAKVIASTATISRAAEQVRSLYGRDALLFPPQGLEAGESFFAHISSRHPGRLFVGVFPTGLPSQQTAMVRVLSTLLQAPASCVESNPAAIDPYWTLVGYFNSIRELGSTATLVSADIREYLSVTHERLGMAAVWGADAASRRRFITSRGSLELTGRVSGNIITEALQQLFVRYEGPEKSRGEGTRPEDRRDPPVDVCLATNMIQVGLDVPRLGLMVVAGQPKMTSEYIQASSRVGRGPPGLVVAVYSPSKPRDRSHYEHFRAYHQSIYRYVEPTSVTPFALPVRERALHALIIALSRFWGGTQMRDSPAGGPSTALEDRVRETLLARVHIVDADEEPATLDMIRRFIAEWRRLPPSRYGNFGPPDQTTPMMYPSGSQALPAWQDRAHATPSSLRNVDAECDAKVVTSYPRP
jgi:hypothetical protein